MENQKNIQISEIGRLTAMVRIEHFRHHKLRDIARKKSIPLSRLMDEVIDNYVRNINPEINNEEMKNE
jgi:predicted DNA-binding ribbon-helix-helix protein